ncbi:MAG TPA: dehydrogenase, partial [Planctomycetaceae bacterium]|nr:dehydrogenase [Planctomycetaceae bacterium]
GAEVGPDITRNGRNNWEQLLQNVFDPSAVIGPAYQARTLVTIEGRVLTGLPIEESEERIVLKIQGGKQETIPRDQIEFYKVSETSMMPEDLEKQLTPQQLADLFAYLALDRPPTDPQAQVLSGAPKQKVRKSN